MRTQAVEIDRRAAVGTLLVICVSIEMMLFALDYHLSYSVNASGSEAVRNLFSTAREDGLAGWFGIMQTAMIAATLWLIVALVRRSGTRLQRAGWTAIAVFFSYLAFDDGAQIHERVGTAYHEYFTGAGQGFAAWTLELFPSYRWQIVFLPIFAAMGLFIFAFLMRQLRGWKARTAVFVALALLAAAVGLDFLEGLPTDHPLNVYTTIVSTHHLEYWSARTFGRAPYTVLLHFSKSIEETLEMLGMTLFWCVFLGQLLWQARDLRIRAVSTDRFTAVAPIARRADGAAKPAPLPTGSVGVNPDPARAA